VIIPVDRWLVNCRACKQRFVQDGASPPSEHDCPVFGPGVKRRPSEVKRILWRPPRSGREHCRMSEPRHIPAIVDPPGECGWSCKGSLSPTCYCPCSGVNNGVTQLKSDNAVDGSGLALIDEIRRRTPDREVKRRGRKST